MAQVHQVARQTATAMTRRIKATGRRSRTAAGERRTRSPEGRVSKKVVCSSFSEELAGSRGAACGAAAGEFFGEACLADQVRRMSSALAAGLCVIVTVTKKAMVRAMHKEPAFAELFNTYLLSRNVQIESDLVDQLFNSAERRLARLLLLLANFAKEEKMEMVVPKISRDVLAARVGTTKSKIDFFMTKFRKLGFIEYDADSSGKSERLKVHASLLNVVVHD